MKKLILSFFIAGAVSGVHAQKTGTPDSSFQSTGIMTWDAGGLNHKEIYGESVVGPNGDLYFASYKSDGGFDAMISHVLADGSPDPNFGSNGLLKWDFTLGGNEIVRGIYLLANGKLFVTGYASGPADYDVFVARLNANGTPDVGFGSGGVKLYDLGGADAAGQIAVRGDGRILVGGHTDESGTKNFFLLLLESDGTPVNGFGTDGVVQIGFNADDETFTAMHLDEQDDVYVCGRTTGASTSIALAKVTKLGNLDSDFGLAGRFAYQHNASNTFSNNMKMDANGKLVVVGYYLNGTNEDAFLMRLNTDASMDNTFGSSGVRSFGLTFANKGDERIYDVDFQADGKLVVSGRYYHNLLNHGLIMRLKDNGSADIGFGTTNGYFLVDGATYSGCYLGDIHVLDVHSILVSGVAKVSSTPDLLMMKVHASEPPATSVQSIAVQQLDFYPNPCHDHVNISAELGDENELFLFNSSGQQVAGWKNVNGRISLPDNLETGVYFLKARNKTAIFSGRIMVM